VGEAVIFGCCKVVKDRIVCDPEISAEQVDQELPTRHDAHGGWSAPAVFKNRKRSREAVNKKPACQVRADDRMVFGGENLENDGWVIDSAGKTNSTLDEWFPDGGRYAGWRLWLAKLVTPIRIGIRSTDGREGAQGVINPGW
jgi:hypothetical protein